MLRREEQRLKNYIKSGWKQQLSPSASISLERNVWQFPPQSSMSSKKYHSINITQGYNIITPIRQILGFTPLLPKASKKPPIFIKKLWQKDQTSNRQLPEVLISIQTVMHCETQLIWTKNPFGLKNQIRSETNNNIFNLRKKRVQFLRICQAGIKSGTPESLEVEQKEIN